MNTMNLIWFAAGIALGFLFRLVLEAGAMMYGLYKLFGKRGGGVRSKPADREVADRWPEDKPKETEGLHAALRESVGPSALDRARQLAIQAVDILRDPGMSLDELRELMARHEFGHGDTTGLEGCKTLEDALRYWRIAAVAGNLRAVAATELSESAKLFLERVARRSLLVCVVWLRQIRDLHPETVEYLRETGVLLREQEA